MWGSHISSFKIRGYLSGGGEGNMIVGGSDMPLPYPCPSIPSQSPPSPAASHHSRPTGPCPTDHASAPQFQLTAPLSLMMTPTSDPQPPGIAGSLCS